MDCLRGTKVLELSTKFGIESKETNNSRTPGPFDLLKEKKYVLGEKTVVVKSMLQKGGVLQEER